MTRVQTARDLKKLLQDVPDDTPVIGVCRDHTYYPVSLKLGTALYEGKNSWVEDFGEEDTPESEYGKRMSVLIVE